MARRFGAEMVDLARLWKSSQSPRPSFCVDLNLLQSPAVGLQSGIGQKIVRTGITGVRLRDGDRIVSLRSRVRPYPTRRRRAPALVQTTAKQTWRYRTGALYSHIPFRLLAHDVRMRG
jgi:hypothetical protein